MTAPFEAMAMPAIGGDAMEALRRGFLAMRLAVGAVALYALLLQAFVLAAAPASAFGPAMAAACSQDGSYPEQPPGHGHSRHHDCCIMACAAGSCAHVAMASEAAVFLPRSSRLFPFAPTPATAARRPLTFLSSARGPPQRR